MPKRPLTPGYILFFLLFSPDTWQVLIGLTTCWFLTPIIVSPGMKPVAAAVLYLMVATIGYAASRGPARGISRLLKKLILGDKAPAESSLTGFNAWSREGQLRVSS